MPYEELRAPRVPARTGAAWLAVPLLAATAGALGWAHVHRLRSTGAGADPELSIAVLAAAACLVVAGWWIGGLLMLSVAAVARRCRWTRLEQWAGRLTPALVARTAAALVGAQLIAVAPAHADDAAPSPFWGPPATGTEQLADGAVGSPGTGTGGTEAWAHGSAAASSAVPGTGDPAVDPSPSGPAAPSGAAAAAQDGAPPSAPADSPTATTVPGAEAADATGTPRSGTRANLPARERVIEGTVTVLSGDTLWDLTAELLRPGATDDAVCRHLPSWLEHNALAQDGDLIRPGDQLRVPPQLLDAAGSRP